MVFVRNGAQGEAYALFRQRADAMNPHHRAADRALPDGELVVMDYCPELSYYRCDVHAHMAGQRQVQRLAARAVPGFYNCILRCDL